MELTYRKNFNFTSLLIILMCLLLTACDQNKNLNLYCLTYDGNVTFYISKQEKDFNSSIGTLGYSYSGKGDSFIFADPNDVIYTASKFYKDAQLIQSKSKGIELVLMPDGLHGVADIWKDKSGNEMQLQEYPVLCYKTNSSLKLDH